MKFSSCQVWFGALAVHWFGTSAGTWFIACLSLIAPSCCVIPFSLFFPCFSLQIVLHFSLASPTLQAGAQKFPATVSCAAIDGVHEWPQEAQLSISRRLVEEAEGVEVQSFNSSVF